MIGIPVTEAQRNKIVALYNDGVEIQAIAERFAISRYAVHAALKVAGVAPNRANRKGNDGP